MKNEETRIKWKDNYSNGHYGVSYATLCCDRKKIIDQLYEVMKMIEEDKKNPKKGCR